MKLSIRCIYFLPALIIFSSCFANSTLAQTTEQTAEINSQVEGDLNNVIQIPIKLLEAQAQIAEAKLKLLKPQINNN